MQLYSAEQVAETLGISARRVRALAASRGRGRRVGRAWVFTAGDIAAMRSRPEGWPRGRPRRNSRRSD